MTSRFGRRFSVAQAAAFLGFSADQVYRLIAARKIPVHLLPVAGTGRKRQTYWFYENELEAWVAQTRVEPTALAPERPTLSPAPSYADISDLMPAIRRFS